MAALEVSCLSREEVKSELAAAEMTQSRALAGATVYDLKANGTDCLLIALPGGEGLRVEIAKPPPRRRRADTAKPLSPESL